jgi:hypothetical protein
MSDKRAPDLFRRRPIWKPHCDGQEGETALRSDWHDQYDFHFNNHEHGHHYAVLYESERRLWHLR